MKVSPHLQPLAKPHFLHSPSCQTGFKQKFPLRRTPGLILLIRVLSRFLSILNCAPNPPQSLSDAPQPPAWDSGEATLTILVCSAENLEDKRAELGAQNRPPAPKSPSWPACPLHLPSSCPAWSQPPAQLSPPGPFPTRGRAHSRPRGLLPSPAGPGLVGGCSKLALCTFTSHIRVDPEFFLIHQPLERSQLEAGGETGQDAAGRSRAPIPDLNPNSAWFVPDSAHSRLFLCQLLETLPCRQWLALPLWVPVYSVTYRGTAQG